MEALPLPCEHDPALRTALGDDLDRVLRPLLLVDGEGPELRRLVMGSCTRWAEQLVELFLHLQQDLPLLRARFLDGEALRLLAVAPGLSDLHHGGRTVHVLAFDRLRLVYKPRQVELERRVLRLVGWLGEQLGTELRGVVMLQRDKHAWCEYVDFQHFQGAVEAQAFFERAGVLAFACYLLGVTDGHADNVSTTRSGPVLVDAETALHPDFRAELVPWEQPDDTVLRSGLVHSLARMVHDFRGQEALIRSFSKAWTTVLVDVDLRAELGRRLEKLAGCRSRVVFRATHYYKQVLARSLSHDGLRSTSEREALLRRELLEPLEGREALLPLVESELASLRELDVPHFTASTTGTDVRDATGAVATGVLRLSGLDAARQRLASLNHEGLERVQALLVVLLAG